MMSFRIIHVDMDAFFASVEIRDHPDLRGKPLIIGSLPRERGVVSTCSYEARKYGVRSAMNIKEAYKLCPHGIFMHPNIEKYRAVSEKLHSIWYSYASEAEAIALDEAYLDVTDRSESFEEARDIAHMIQQQTKNELGLPCSVGLAYSKTAAKIASEERKPLGYFEIQTAEEFVALMRNRDVRALFTVGTKTAEKLYALGIRTVQDVLEKQEKVIQILGHRGLRITKLASGLDERKVVSYRPQDAKSISREVTFQVDVTHEDFLNDVLLLLAICIERRAKHHGLSGKGLTLKIITSDMKCITRSRKMSTPAVAATLWKEGQHLLKKIEQRPIRLIGLSLYDLSCDGQLPLMFGDLFAAPLDKSGRELKDGLLALQGRYGLDFEGHLHQLDQGETLYKTIEYMRRHRPSFSKL